jgi:hypothetical protein
MEKIRFILVVSIVFFAYTALKVFFTRQQKRLSSS